MLDSLGPPRTSQGFLGHSSPGQILENVEEKLSSSECLLDFLVKTPAGSEAGFFLVTLM